MSKYYIQDRRQYVGNAVLWWAKDRRGYTCHLEKAHVFEEWEAQNICGRSGRGTDIAWPKDMIDKLATLHVDMQSLPNKPLDAIQGLNEGAADKLTHAEENRRITERTDG